MLEIRTQNRALAEQLLQLTTDAWIQTFPHQPDLPQNDADAIITHIEVNDHHGVGVLIRRLFGRSENILSIRSQNVYGGYQEFGARHIQISHGAVSRDMVFWNVLEALRGCTVKRVLCSPYFSDDALTAIALKNIFAAPLCTYIMDDQNLSTDAISDSVMSELLSNSSLCLAISREMCAGYEQKYGQRVSWLPPLVPSRFIPTRLNQGSESRAESTSGVMVGNLWGSRWTELLRHTVRGSGTTLRWYNNGEFRWLPCPKEELIPDGIVPQEGPRHTDEELIEILRAAAFAVVPSGVLDDTDDRHYIAQLSLPSRIPYIFATSHTPILVLGSPETAAARFVTETGIGMVAPYERQAFQQAVQRIISPQVSYEMRRAAFELSGRFTDLGAADWIWRSLDKGEPADRRYEAMFGKLLFISRD